MTLRARADLVDRAPHLDRERRVVGRVGAEGRLGVRFLFAVDARGADMVPLESVSERSGSVGDARP
jgi:hypothetical protein